MLSTAVNRARAARKDDKGFTLIELLIVIVILGILAGIVVFSVQGITDRGDKSACKANVATVNTAIEAFYAKTGAYPTSDADLTAGANRFINPPMPPNIITSYAGTPANPPAVKLASAC